MIENGGDTTPIYKKNSTESNQVLFGIKLEYVARRQASALGDKLSARRQMLALGDRLCRLALIKR